VFGAGGGTSSYEEVREVADLIVLWGSNAREAHPIFFHHVLKAIHRGAKLMVVDPRRTTSAQWADLWLGLDVGTDIPLANAVAREIVVSGLANDEFIGRATTQYDAFRESIEPWTLEEAERVTGVPAEAIRELAHAFGNAKNPQLCWTLGITEHHNAVDNVFALINLALLVGGVGRYGAGLQPLRGQNNVQGGGDMGAIPNKLPGFQDLGDDLAREKFERAWGTRISPTPGLHLTGMFEAMEHGTLKAVYVVGENPAQSEADKQHTVELLKGLDHLVVQDLFLTRTAELADVVLPGCAGWAESEGTVTSSERRVQRVRKALDPPGEARDDIEIVYELARRLGHDLGSTNAEDIWNEVRSLSPMHAGMSYARLEELRGIQWPCWDDEHPGEQFIHSRLWQDVVVEPAPFMAVEHAPPVDALDDEFPLRLTTGRRLESFNTGVQSGGFSSPLHVNGEALRVSPEDGARYGLADGGRAVVASRRGEIEAPVAFDTTLRPGLAFMNLHFPELVDTNVLTIDATDPRSGTAEFKATAIRVSPVA
jgi:predicted molibdopterin-dependent oxidoreductase YjgC